MNLLWPFRKPAPQPLRAIVATKAENLLAQRKAADVRIELAVYAATTTPEQRKAEAEAYFARARHAIRLRAKRSSRNAGKAVGV